MDFVGSFPINRRVLNFCVIVINKSGLVRCFTNFFMAASSRLTCWNFIYCPFVFQCLDPQLVFYAKGGFHCMGQSLNRIYKIFYQDNYLFNVILKVNVRLYRILKGLISLYLFTLSMIQHGWLRTHLFIRSKCVLEISPSIMAITVP